MKEHFNKELVMTKEDNKDFKNSTKCWICDNDYIDTDVEVRDHCHITGKQRGSAHIDCNINLKLNHKIPIAFHGSFQFLSFSLDSLVKNLNKDDFKYSSQEFEKSKLDLVKQQRFYPYDYMTHFKKFKEKLPSKKKFYSSLMGKKISEKEFNHVLNVWNKFEMKIMKYYHDLYLKCDV